LDKSIADRDKVKLTPAGKVTGVGTQGGMSYTGKLESFTIGKKLALGKPTVHFLNLTNLDKVRLADGRVEKSAGLLGLGFFNAAKVSVDYKRSALFINTTPIDGGLASVYKQIGHKTAKMVQVKNGRHYVKTTLKGKTAYFLVDTGAHANVLFIPAAKSLGYPLEDSKIKVNTVGVKSKTTKMVTVSKMQIGELNINGRLQMIAMPHEKALPKMDGAPIVGILGSTFFEAVGATLDFASDMIMMNPAKG